MSVAPGKCNKVK